MEKLRIISGIALICLPFVGLFILTIMKFGATIALYAWGGGLIVVACVGLGVIQLLK